MALKACLRSAGTISIIPSTGIQFLDFGFRESDAGLPVDWDCHDEHKGGSWGSDGDFCLVKRDSEFIDRESQSKSVSYSIDRREVLDFVQDRWLPIPVFRRSGEAFAQGPTNWARVKTVKLEAPDEEGNDYRVVVALDTNLMDSVEGRPYLAPSQSDARAGLTFGLARGAAMYWFLSEEWVRLWIREAFKEMLVSAYARKQGSATQIALAEEDLREEIAGAAEPVLRFAAFLDLLAKIELLPSNLKVVDTRSARALDAVDCDLVLDVGNSRTCGLIIERDPDFGADISQAVKLEIRDLSNPHHVYTEPFESRIEFALPKFGKPDLSLLSGRSDGFEWPTIARIGFEAAALAGGRIGNEGRSGMSSPKRYLWSCESPAQPWRFNASSTPGETEHYAAQGTFAVMVNDIGTPLHALETSDPDNLPAMEARYSRSSLFSFALTEVLLHTLLMINSPAHRLRRPNSDNPRRLRRIIMTMPSAIPLAEREILRTRAEQARDLAYLGLRLVQPMQSGPGLNWDDAQISGPEVVLQWDEASATQVVYLYTRVVKHFFGHARRCFEALRRPDAEHEHELRVATLDIGGGTTDLVITDFDCEGQGNSVTVFPEQRFREGFNIAGDDIVYRVVQRHLLEPLQDAAARAGVGAPDALVAALFGGDRGDMDISDRVRRQQFAVQIAAPIAIGLLGLYESYGHDEELPEAVSFNDFFTTGVQPSLSTIDYVNSEVAKRGGQGFDLRELIVPVNLAELDKTIRSVLRPILDVLTEVVWSYGTDLLLVSGRPSRLPTVVDLLVECLPMMVGRIVPLSGFRVGQWYPFRDPEGRIQDPKTTAAVGAMLCAMAEGGIEHFNFRSDRIRVPSSTAKYIGKLDGSGRIPAADTFYEALDLDDRGLDFPDHTFEFRGVMALGFRQVHNDWWPATRLYTLDYASEADRAELHSRTPIHVELKRQKQRGSDLLSENLEIARAEDAGKGRNVRHQLKLQLQTLANDDGYWLDTGILLES